MQYLPTDTDHIPTPARLAAPVHDAQGQLLLPVGANVSPSVLHSLRKHGIQTVQVNIDPSVIPPIVREVQDPAMAHVRTEERLRHLFRVSFSMGQINPLFHLVLEHRLLSERHDAQASRC